MLEPGIYDIPEDQYHAVQALSASRSKVLIDQCPAALYYQMKTESGRQTDAMRFGTLFHSIVLYGEEHTQEHYKILVKVDRRTKEYKMAAEEYPASRIISCDDMDRALYMRDALMMNEIAAKLLVADGPNEESFFWIDDLTDCPCKARIDTYKPEFRTVIDLKTAKDASPNGAESAIKKYGYWRQAAHYLEAVNTFGIDCDSFVLIFVEKEPPFLTNVIALSPQTLQAGKNAMRKCKEVYAECIKSEVWPGYEDITEFSLNKFDLKKWGVE